MQQRRATNWHNSKWNSGGCVVSDCKFQIKSFDVFVVDFGRIGSGNWISINSISFIFFVDSLQIQYIYWIRYFQLTYKRTCKIKTKAKIMLLTSPFNKIANDLFDAIYFTVSKQQLEMQSCARDAEYEFKFFDQIGSHGKSKLSKKHCLNHHWSWVGNGVSCIGKCAAHKKRRKRLTQSNW